jgi:hypothetical protein
MTTTDKNELFPRSILFLVETVWAHPDVYADLSSVAVNSDSMTDVMSEHDEEPNQFCICIGDCLVAMVLIKGCPPSVLFIERETFF